MVKNIIFVVVGIIVIGIAGRAIWAWQQTKIITQKIDISTSRSQEPLTQQNTQSSTIFSNVAGFSFSVPAGWHIWEGPSAGSELLLSDSFVSVMSEAIEERASKKGLSIETVRKMSPYVEFMKNWTVSTAKIVSFTSANVDYKNRDLAAAGKILSTLIESQNIIDQRSISMAFSTSTLKQITPVNDINSERKNLTINGSPAVYARSKKYKLVDDIIVMVSVNINGNAHTFMFNGFVKKDDAIASDALVSFISNLNIKSTINL